MGGTNTNAPKGAEEARRYAPRPAPLSPCACQLSLLLWLAIPTSASATETDRSIVDLPPLQVVAAAPGAGATLPRSSRPYPAHRLDAEELDAMLVVDISQALNRRVPGISLNAVQGNPLQPDLQYRGFTGSPLLGTPQGLVVYQDGVRLNEVFGDTVNWDLLPVAAIAQVDVIGGADPVFGLNALGGAISFRSKDGFSAPGRRLSYEGGSFGREQATLQVGGHGDRIGYFVSADRMDERGWRDFSPSKARHYFGTIGWRGERSQLDVSVTGARTMLTGNGAVPVELLAQRRRSVFTAPDETANQLQQASARGSIQLGEHALLSATVYRRNVDTDSFNGDASDAEACDDDPTVLCHDDDERIIDQSGRPVPSTFDAVNNISSRRQGATGGNVQLVLFGDQSGSNHQLVLGADYLDGNVGFRSSVEPAMLQDDRRTTRGSALEFPDDAVDVHAVSRSRALYLTDTLVLGEAFTLTASVRYNQTRVEIADRSGKDPDLNGIHDFSRVNPAVGATWTWSPRLHAYASYSQSTRAPTPVELSCADEASPCKLPNQFISDPPLDQVVAKSWEAGLRSGNDPDALQWQMGLFSTTNADDILFQSTGGTSSNEGFFANVADTRRRGLEASAQGSGAGKRLQWYASYVWLDAVFRGAFVESSANHPLADAGGLLPVQRGDRLPGLARHHVKAGIDWSLLPALRVGVVGEYRSGVYLRGDEANLLPRTGGYAVFGMHARWQPAPRMSLHVRIENLLDRRHVTFGALGEPDEVLPELTDPRFLGPGAPRGAWMGMRYEF